MSTIELVIKVLTTLKDNKDGNDIKLATSLLKDV